MTGIGKYKGPPVKIQMAEDIKPVIQPPRRIPLHYIQPLKDSLKEMVEQEVIKGPLQEEEEGSWISNLVITDKKWDDEAKKERAAHPDQGQPGLQAHQQARLPDARAHAHPGEAVAQAQGQQQVLNFR